MPPPSPTGRNLTRTLPIVVGRITLLALYLGAPIPILAQSNTGTGGVDVVTMLLSYGVAAPFAALCWFQMNRSNAKLDEALAAKDRLQNEAIERAREDARRLAPLLYDGARLYEEGNRAMVERAKPVDEVAQRLDKVITLLEGQASAPPT